jgi:hypothetical protein
MRTGTDGACSLLFCAAKRSGAFPSNMPAGERRLSSEDAGLAEGSCVTSQRFHEAVLRVIVSPSWGPALCYHGRSGYQPLSLVPNPDGVVVCIV